MSTESGDQAELEARIAELQATVDHRDWRVAELEKHAANLETLREASLTRIGELEAHAGNLEARVAELEAQVHALDLRRNELELHTQNLSARIHDGGDQLVAGYRSRFGGLWTDRLDAEERLAARRERGEIDATTAAQIEHWIEWGFLELPGAVPECAVDALRADTDALFERERDDIYVNFFENGALAIETVGPRHRDMNVKVLDLYAHFESARAVIFAAPLFRFLHTIFEDDPLAFQSLYFRLGSEQPMHQDTAYVGVKSPMEFVGVWIALEDVTEGSGELTYYPKSHGFDEWVWDGRRKRMPGVHADHEAYLASLHEQARSRGIEARCFRPKKGDALVWHADLAHGGMPRSDREATRTSIVTHFCPLRTDPIYFANTDQHSLRHRHPASGGRYCWIRHHP